MQIKIGCDPEVFLYDLKAKKYVSAAGYFPGTKQEPYKVDKGAIQVDGTALEFNIDPAETELEFAKNIKVVFSQMESMVKEVNPDWVIKAEPVAHFTNDLWETIPQDAKILGCDPDYDFKGNINPSPGDKLLNTPIRTGSGHIHIGWSEGEDAHSSGHFEDCRFMADKFYSNGVFGVKTTSEQERLKYYGMNGSFRPKSYGVELRSPSNVWLRTSQGHTEMFRKTKSHFERFAGV